MDTEKCRVLLTALSEGTLSGAAEKLGYTVSGISRSLASLENDCGLTLLFRGRTGISLTPDGEKMLPLFRELVHVSELCEDEIRSIKGLSEGTVNIGVSYVYYFRQVIKLIHDFKKIYPGITVNIVQGTSSELKNDMCEHKLDFILASEREGRHKFIRLKKVPMSACVPPTHPAALKGYYSLEDFEKDEMIAPFPEMETDYGLTLKNLGIHPNIRHVTTDIYSAYCMVEAGLGVTFLNSLEPECWDGDVEVLPVRPDSQIDIGIMYPEEGLSKSAEKLMRVLLEKLKGSSQEQSENV